MTSIRQKPFASLTALVGMLTLLPAVLSADPACPTPIPQVGTWTPLNNQPTFFEYADFYPPGEAFPFGGAISHCCLPMAQY